VKQINLDKVVKTPTPAIEDDGRVRLGMVSPSFSPVRVAPAGVADSGNGRTGYMSPSFLPTRTR
jgi:hypothetical protein